MQTFQSIDQIVDFAIAEEEAAIGAYRELAAATKSDAMRSVFEGFAREEERHKEKLLSVKHGTATLLPAGAVRNLNIADYLVENDAQASAPALDYQQALIVAMKKEKAAFKLYSALAEQTTDAAFRELFLALAQEEAKHKLRFEVEYDEEFLSEI